MRGKLWFIGGLAAGFVLGARAGREKYEEIVQQARKLADHPTVQEAKGTAQAQANRLMSEGKDRLSQSKLGEKMSSGSSHEGHSHSGANGLTSSSASSSSASPTKPMP
ncbi:hypothetical protein Ais01nite_65980 [Asanoa ishikariensis]|uniref:YtxH domain-containing protein n=1 Tax=Asanoa ishikariensis TaxID=137265 RepID=A0A1H3NK27_9ACTN|nr:hypothetical protein [Asanoa ishikariensis]GIF68563.1 hypothetical protein Ais01nite_65980 [Asanoa ishikariensis]SDY89232.1 hypothetical protein SAMN05421684_2126 [Asanoa ishikariensis]